MTVVTMAGTERDFYTLEPSIRRIALDLSSPSPNPIEAIIRNLQRTWALFRVLRQERPDIAIGMMPTANVVLALAGRLAGVPTIGSERIYPPAMPLGRFWEAARRRVYPLLSCLVAQTEYSAAWLHAHAPAKRVSVIPNPVRYPLPCQTPRTSPDSVRETLRGGRLLLAVGRLAPQKGFDQLLAAFDNLAPQHPDWSLVVLGQGREHGELTAQAARLGLEDRVAFPGAVGNVGEWFAAADAYVMTSRFEGFPNSLLEALAHGVPSLAVDCKTGPRELIETDVNGLIVPKDDTAALVAGLDRLMGDADLRTRLAKRAVTTRETYAVERIAERWEEMFESVCSATKT